jgi:hypothetical protein
MRIGMGMEQRREDRTTDNQAREGYLIWAGRFSGMAAHGSLALWTSTLIPN